MERLRSFLRLRQVERRRLLQAGLLMGAVRLALRMLPFRFVRGLLARLAPAGSPRSAPDEASLKWIPWAVRTAGGPLSATCLVQALAAQTLLARSGHPAHLRIGVARGEGGLLQGHAWVECQGVIVLGQLPDLGRFTAMPILEGQGPDESVRQIPRSGQEIAPSRREPLRNCGAARGNSLRVRVRSHPESGR